MPSLTFRKVRSPGQSDEDALQVELFRAADDRICGWFLGPVRLSGTKVVIPYLPRSKSVPATVAVIRAIEEGKVSGVPVCIVDPDDLWERVWQI